MATKKDLRTLAGHFKTEYRAGRMIGTKILPPTHSLGGKRLVFFSRYTMLQLHKAADMRYLLDEIGIIKDLDKVYDKYWDSKNIPTTPPTNLENLWESIFPEHYKKKEYRVELTPICVVSSKTRVNDSRIFGYKSPSDPHTKIGSMSVRFVRLLETTKEQIWGAKNEDDTKWAGYPNMLYTQNDDITVVVPTDYFNHVKSCKAEIVTIANLF